MYNVEKLRSGRIIWEVGQVNWCTCRAREPPWLELQLSSLSLSLSKEKMGFFCCPKKQSREGEAHGMLVALLLKPTLKVLKKRWGEDWKQMTDFNKQSFKLSVYHFHSHFLNNQTPKTHSCALEKRIELIIHTAKHDQVPIFTVVLIMWWYLKFHPPFFWLHTSSVK